MRNLLSWARALLILWPGIFLVTLILEWVSAVAGMIDKTGRRRHAVARTWAAIVLRLLGPVEVEGLERIDVGRARVYAANHLSAVDIPLLYRYLPFQFRIMAHQKVFRVPLIGWWLRSSGALEIAPESLALSRQALREAIKTLKSGMPLAIFPEGERSPTGDMLRFRPGTFYVAVQAQADIVPIAIAGTYEALPIGSMHVRRARMRMVIGEAIAVAGYTRNDLGALAERTEAAVAELGRRKANQPLINAAERG